MDRVKKKINKLIEDSNQFQWESCSHETHRERFGNAPSAAWKTWTNRINYILNKTVKSDSEPYIYFREAENTQIEGYRQDGFESAKESYLKALTTAVSLIDEGDIFGELIVSAKSDQAESTQVSDIGRTDPQDEKKVFVVHGHDHSLKIELEVFLSHIGLKPIVLHREVDAGKTVIEKFESNSDVSYAFILLTPDEIAYTVDQKDIKDGERKTEARARPNVIFEFGYFVAKLGRNKVCALHKGDVSIPSDLSGFIYKKVENSVEEIGFSLIKELKAAGLKPKV